MNTLRLLYPQWQGGDIANLVPELNKEDSSTGYYLGAELLEFLAPKDSKTKTAKQIISAIAKAKVWIWKRWQLSNAYMMKNAHLIGAVAGAHGKKMCRS